MASSPLFQALRVAYNDDSPEGYWGEKTSTLNFCEEDYVVSYYCAEVCNTLTNLLFLWLGFKGVHNCVSQGHPRIFLVAYLGYVIVGLGSTAFHTSLKCSSSLLAQDIFCYLHAEYWTDKITWLDPMQLIDELSMIYTTCLMVFATFSFSKSSRFSVLLGGGLVLLAGLITSYYHITKDPAFHQACYAALTATVVLRSLYVMETQLRPVLARRNKDKADLILKTMWIMVGTGLLERPQTIHVLTTTLHGAYGYADVSRAAKMMPGASIQRGPPGTVSLLHQVNMSIPNQALEKLIREIESQAIVAQQQIGQARTQMTAKQREMRMVRLTLDEVSTLPSNLNVYEGVGKMFVALPTPQLTQKLEGQIKDREGEVEKLSQKLHYLETTYKNSRQHIDQMLKAQS
ncbi:alkaline phytoceramidase [Colletotrichum lupini]|uniref:Alkaline phytoceramidase n=6 Tax=Colletotrichum acutatum species complex TaxID=2707335 RepID=A0A9Q8T0L5_9PEZI|nr:alkaline phytoceramidase [Colletotrichum lupini]UQC87059.1 alkaline phytoceramidase [Colletotrichum lupini]